jgi:hypothetical protein
MWTKRWTPFYHLFLRFCSLFVSQNVAINKSVFCECKYTYSKSTSKQEASLMQASLISVHVIARHCKVWCLRITWPLISTICLRLHYSWISKKFFILHGTQACYINYLIWNFRPVWSSISAVSLAKQFKSFDIRVPQSSVLSRILYSKYINDTPPNTRCSSDSLYRWHIYATDRKEGYVLRRNLQRCLNSIETWWKRWYIKINEDKPRPVYFSHRLRPPEVHLTLNGRNIPFVKYLDVIFNKRITWRLYIEISKPRPSENLLQSIPYSEVSD